MTDAVDRIGTAYDVVAREHQGLQKKAPAGSRWDRAVLAAFAEIVEPPVLEVGCGPGRITGHLARLGVAIRGIDLSPRMIEVARTTYPDLDFAVGSLFDLDVPDGGLGGLVAWYALVHTPRHLLPAAFGEFFRVLRPGGRLLVAAKGRDERYGNAVGFDVYGCPPQVLIDLMIEAGFVESVRLVRAAEGPETQPQAYVVGVKP